jgi:hypothetical protein
LDQYDLLRVLSQHANWLDLRHLKTLAWMMVGLIHPHWLRGESSLKIGWKWVIYALRRGYELLSTV